MSRGFLVLVVASAAVLFAGQAQKKQADPSQKDEKGELRKDRPKQPTKEIAPPEEDKSLATEEYGFNPLQAQKELQTGNFYFKKGSYRAAANRFREATKWNDGYGEAWLRLGEAEEKLKDPKAAHEAYAKYLEIAGDAKNAAEIRKKLDKLK
jgi:tetratricopeptide (TPR) repeat protein